MARRDDENRQSHDHAALDRIIDAVSRDDGREVERITAELAMREESSLLALEHDAERAARGHRDAERMVDRVRNLFQAVLLNRLLHRRRAGDARHEGEARPGL